MPSLWVCAPSSVRGYLAGLWEGAFGPVVSALEMGLLLRPLTRKGSAFPARQAQAASQGGVLAPCTGAQLWDARCGHGGDGSGKFPPSQRLPVLWSRPFSGPPFLHLCKGDHVPARVPTRAWGGSEGHMLRFSHFNHSRALERFVPCESHLFCDVLKLSHFFLEKETYVIPRNRK